MAAYAALASLMNNIEQVMIHPRLSTSFRYKRMQSLLQKAASLLEFIQSYDHGGMMSEEGEHLERTIARAAHAAEDVIETHTVHQIHAGTADVSPRCSRLLKRMTKDMDIILKKADELKEQGKLREKEEQPSDTTTPMAREAEEEKKTAMVGFEEELIQILDVLTNQQSSRHLISIVGMGGMGKTTLAQNIYQHSLINHHFDVRAWATVSQNYNLGEILSQLLEGVGGSGDELHKHLFGRRYLIILDDVWSVGAWDKVSRYFPDNGNGSRVVLTTRSSIVARNCCSSSSSCFMMKTLDEITSWKLFCQKTFKQETCPCPELEKVGNEIVRLCKGLPLSIVVIGGLLLNSPKSLQVWNLILSNITSNPNSKEKEDSLDILSLSYHHLPPHLKPCFLYMGVFEEDFEIRVSNIIRLWVGEGFLRSASNPVLEEIAEGYLTQLIDRNLIFVKEHSKRGKIKSCGIHDLVRDLSLKVGLKQEFFHMSIHEMQGTERRIICQRQWILLKIREYIEAPLARSIMGTYEMSDNNHELVRVCDDAYVELASEIYEKVNLRCIYCHFSDYPFKWLLSSSISRIWNLQTLIFLVSFRTTVVVPIEIWKMRQLRHIKCPGICLPDPRPSDGFVTMDNLQTLKTAEGLRLWAQVFDIIPNIKKLSIRFDTYNNLCECYKYLGCLDKLESLSLRLGSFVKTPDPCIRLTLPISLNKLVLVGGPLKAEDLWMIGSLPQLQVLRMETVILNDKFSFIEGQFLRLKCLQLRNLHLTNLLNADNSHFPVLEKLFLWGLYNLEEIPSSIGEIPTLELIHVECCSVSAVVSAIRIKENQLENQGSDALQVRVELLNSGQEVKKLMELVEIEGLTIDNIHLSFTYS